MSEATTEKYSEDVRQFLSEYFEVSEYGPGEDLPNEEQEVIRWIVGWTEEDLLNNVGKLGIVLDFLLVAEQLADHDSQLSEFNPGVTGDEILERYDRKDTQTLTFLLNGETYGIRPVHDSLIKLFRSDLKRTNFPSSPGHHTGSWAEYREVLGPCFSLSTAGRYETAHRLFELGLERLAEKSFESRNPPFPEPFAAVANEYERKHDDEEAGSAYQALSYGYVKAEWPHLSLRASKVRTGSARQNRYGDIDGFYGPDLMLSVEVKDKEITGNNVHAELDTIIDVAENTTAVVVTICRDVTSEAREALEEAGVHVITDERLREELRLWDYHKQNRALQGMVHFFANIEENPDGVQRLLQFVETVDPDNPALAHLIDGP